MWLFLLIRIGGGGGVMWEKKKTHLKTHPHWCQYLHKRYVVCISVCVCVCGDNWSPLAPVGVCWCELLAAVWFEDERCVLFYHSQVLQWKNITAKTWTEFRPACGPSEENSRESAVQFPLHLPQTHGRVCWSSRVVDTRAAEKTQVY